MHIFKNVYLPQVKSYGSYVSVLTIALILFVYLLDHNRIHAADVLHGVYYLTQHPIPGFNSSLSRRGSLTNETSSPNTPSDKIENESREDEIEEIEYTEESYTYGCICDLMPGLELMALYVAAAMHDFDHPGRTNAFLVATLNSKVFFLSYLKLSVKNKEIW